MSDYVIPLLFIVAAFLASLGLPPLLYYLVRRSLLATTNRGSVVRMALQAPLRYPVLLLTLYLAIIIVATAAAFRTFSPPKPAEAIPGYMDSFDRLMYALALSLPWVWCAIALLAAAFIAGAIARQAYCTRCRALMLGRAIREYVSSGEVSDYSSGMGAEYLHGYPLHIYHATFWRVARVCLNCSAVDEHKETRVEDLKETV